MNDKQRKAMFAKKEKESAWKSAVENGHGIVKTPESMQRLLAEGKTKGNYWIRSYLIPFTVNTDKKWRSAYKDDVIMVNAEKFHKGNFFKDTLYVNKNNLKQSVWTD